MSVFVFKQFEVKHTNAAMKVGTDSVLLGSLLQANNPQTILDIGTGTGVLALMMAQRFEHAHIDAVEVDATAAEEASYNFTQSKWGNRIRLQHQPFQQLTDSGLQYDLIISNPPYYDVQHQFMIDEVKRATARHSGSLSFHDLLSGIQQLLSTTGVCWMVLPKAEHKTLVLLAQDYNLYSGSQINIAPKASKPYNRVVFSLVKKKVTPVIASFVIHEVQGYSNEYKEATFPFLLWKK